MVNVINERKLKDFRHEKFLAINPDSSYGYEQWLRALCERVGGFEPEITALADSADSLVGDGGSGTRCFSWARGCNPGKTTAVELGG
jgi:hypothetical protein